MSGDIIGAAIDWLVAMGRATALARQSGARYRVCAIDDVWLYEPVSGTERAQ